MACDYSATQEIAQRKEKALKQLEADIATGKITVIRGLDGTLKVANWGKTEAAQAGLFEACALHKLVTSPKTNWLVKQKLQNMGINSTSVKTLKGCHHK